MENEYLFVYGTLKKSYDHPLHNEINLYSDFFSEGVYNGKLFLIGEYPGAIVSSNPNDIVYGEVYLLTNANRLLSILDEYEECEAHSPQPTEYIRSLQLIHLNNNASVKAWIYLYNYNTDCLLPINSGKF